LNWTYDVGGSSVGLFLHLDLEGNEEYQDLNNLAYVTSLRYRISYHLKIIYLVI